MSKESEKIFESKTILSGIINTAEDAIISVDYNQNIILFNQGAEKIFCYSAEEIIGKNLGMLLPESIRSDHSEHINNFGKSEIVSKGMKERSEITGLRKNGDIFPAEANISQVEIDGRQIFTAILRDVSEQKLIENKLRESLKEKEILLQEVNHRVKNNLQVILSLFALQGESTDDPERIAMLSEIRLRIQSMAMIHEKIYKSERLGQINFHQYVKDLTTEIFHTYSTSSGSVRLNLEVAPVSLEINRAVPFALILNELTSNALKYAFTAKEKGNLSISLKLEKDKLLLLTVCDDGIGIPKKIQFSNTKTLGLRLVRVLTRQLNGKAELKENPYCKKSRGTMFVFRFPLE
jgi:PAS domain S-box-containing protein